MTTPDELTALRAEIADLRAAVEELTRPRHGSQTVLGEAVFVDPACVLLSAENATITIGDHSQVWRGGEWVGPVTVGERVFVNQGSYIRPLVTIEDDVSIGPFVRLISDSHDISPGAKRTGTPRKLPIRIGSGTWIGAGATVVGGVTVGSRCIVAVGAVVTEDVPDNVFVAGVPARIVRHIRDAETFAELVAVDESEDDAS